MLDIMSAAIKCFRSGSIVWAEEGQEFCFSDDSSGQQCALLSSLYICFYQKL